jgi:hypothetical protein
MNPGPKVPSLPGAPHVRHYRTGLHRLNIRVERLSAKAGREIPRGGLGVSLSGRRTACVGARTGGANHISKGARGWGAGSQ